ncbi:hypothetical protein VOLCADRAFT_87352 [Volvox carteri f. nagariensis]|uniref:Uncharacterized protein n=1 Tax=Volvox carteri f. nagariensis TaxID=3068 RepID=D8TL46_VOLCA|nr:uncharacterized protein VOLCADRAFT_87352 [Volvox carteri f. nagariensis]EFJ51806.1 hypothetical protein VOLCADRAFT_87352 [Volvox carteri f. nagariensis]|eukprot:XP_002947216.1 hypothetical protein VOLCADRAFT_87352 [Volvox carteri f. nagariensis]
MSLMVVGCCRIAMFKPARPIRGILKFLSLKAAGHTIMCVGAMLHTRHGSSSDHACDGDSCSGLEQSRTFFRAYVSFSIRHAFDECTNIRGMRFAQPESKIYPDVIEPKQREEGQLQPTFQEGPLTLNRASTAEAGTPSRRGLTLDPVEPFQPTEPCSPAVAQRVEAVVTDDSEPANDNPATSNVVAASPKAAKEQEALEITDAEGLGRRPESFSDRTAQHEVQEEPAADDAKDPAEHGLMSDGESESSGDTSSSASESDSTKDEESDDDASSQASSARDADKEEEDNRQSSDEEGEPDAMSEDSSIGLEAFTFAPAALVALEQFHLKDKAEILSRRLAGRACVQLLQSICLHVLDTGAAAQNCQLLLAQIQVVVHVIAHAQQIGARKAVRMLLEDLQPILVGSEAVIRSWSHKGTMKKFMSGRAADEEFLELHLQLKEFSQSPAFVHLFSSLPPDEAAELSELQASQQLGGYTSVEANRAAFERLLLLFILRYKPTKVRTQRQRLVDLLAAYNKARSCGGGDGNQEGQGGEGADFGGKTVDEQIEHLAKTRLGRAAKHAVPLMQVLMTNMWGADPASVPPSRVGKWRLAVRMALEPLRVATGSLQLPQVPEEDVQEWVES